MSLLRRSILILYYYYKYTVPPGLSDILSLMGREFKLSFPELSRCVLFIAIEVLQIESSGGAEYIL